MRIIILSSFVFSLLNCLSQVKILEHSEQVEIIELRQLNTKERECNLSVSPNGNELYFMSDRQGSNSIGDGDIYCSNFINNNWISPFALSDNINTIHGEDEPSFSSNSETMYYQSWKDDWAFTDGPYYESKLENGQWQDGIGLGGGISQFFKLKFSAHFGYATDGMAISPDGNLFIVACGPDYYGSMDLYYSEKINGEWSFPSLLPVSTNGDERSVFIAADSKTIYFSSNGYAGFGGMDLYKTTFINGDVGPVINLGKPFNTKKDDMGFVITQNGNSAFLIRDLDIYFADLANLDKEIKPIQDLSTTHYDNSNILIDSLVEFENTIKKVDLISQYDSTQFKSEIANNFTLNETILFEFDHFELLEQEITKLNDLIQKTNNKIKRVFIEGHTDNIGSLKYNEELSYNRVKAVKDYLSSRLSNEINFNWSGETKPTVMNNSNQNRRLNRRVEIFIECY